MAISPNEDLVAQFGSSFQTPSFERHHSIIETQVQKLAKAAAMVEPLDLPGLVALGEMFTDLIAMLDGPSLEPLAVRAELLEEIVMHEITDLESTFAVITRSIEYAQEIVNAISEGTALELIRQPIQRESA